MATGNVTVIIVQIFAANLRPSALSPPTSQHDLARALVSSIIPIRPWTVTIGHLDRSSLAARPLVIYQGAV
ncbi:hypothetical protein MY3296_007840 [Beauveria thailandica]